MLEKIINKTKIVGLRFFSLCKYDKYDVKQDIKYL